MTTNPRRLSDEAMRTWRRRKAEVVPLLILGGVGLAYWQRGHLGLPPLAEDEGFYVLVALLLVGFYLIQRRLRDIQLRLAWMQDSLDALSGVEQHHVETELGA